MEQQTNALTPKRRKLMLSVLDGYQPFHAVTAQLHYLDNHFPSEKLDAALYWLLKNGIKGKRFVEWFKGDCAGSQLEMHRHLLARLEKTRGLAPVFAGKDFRV